MNCPHVILTAKTKELMTDQLSFLLRQETGKYGNSIQDLNVPGSCLDSQDYICLNDDSFSSPIGIIYYLWSGDSQRDLCVYYISNNKDSFLRYIKTLEGKYKNLRLYLKKSKYIESSILKYLNGQSKKIGIDYSFLTGSDFEIKIWTAAASIGYGQVATYKEVAELAGRPGAWRAAGTALGNNPLMLIIPCHRIIKSSGYIGLYGGGEEVKEHLLELEANSL